MVGFVMISLFSVTVTDAEAVQPVNASVAVTVYVPALVTVLVLLLSTPAPAFQLQLLPPLANKSIDGLRKVNSVDPWEKPSGL